MRESSIVRRTTRLMYFNTRIVKVMSVPLKILFIGFDDIPKAGHKEKIDSCNVIIGKMKEDFRFKGKGGIPSFLDYHIIFVNLPKINLNRYLLLRMGNKRKDIELFLRAGGIITVFCPHDNYQGTYDWLPLSINVKNSGGDTTEPNMQHPLGKTLQKFKPGWKCYFEIDHLNFPPELIIGRNMAKLPVSLALTIENGNIILMPQFKEEQYLPVLNHLLESIKKNYFQKDISPVAIPTPTWLSKYQFDEEKKLTQQFEEMKIYIQRYNEIKKILYENGIELTKAVAHVFSELGFKVNEKENEGFHDIEIEYNEFSSIIEVKGLKGYANVGDLRQLLDHYIEASELNESLKGIFILNHFLENEPLERKDPFSERAIRLGTKNEFCMMTTVDLFNLYSEFIKGKIEIADIITILKETNGCF